MILEKLSSFLPARKVPDFAIVSLARSGSTALYRALSCSSGVRIAYEPGFGDSWNSCGMVEKSCGRLFQHFSGIKHVWDPNGWPYTNAHVSSVETLTQSQKWLEVNSNLLGCSLCSQKVVFLRRRNQVARTVSDLLGQQTNLWGHDPSLAQSDREVDEYRKQLRQRELEPLDTGIIDWYLSSAPAWEDGIASAVPAERVLTVYYEDLFGADVGLETRMARLAAIGEWLEIPIGMQDQKIRAIMGPAAKLNSTATTYDRIPNLAEIVSRFGEF